MPWTLCPDLAINLICLYRLCIFFSHTVVMVVILNNSSFQFSKVHAQFQGCWHKKKLESLCMAIINSNEKKYYLEFWQ